MIDTGLLIYGLLLAAMFGWAIFADARCRARRRLAASAEVTRKFLSAKRIVP